MSEKKRRDITLGEMQDECKRELGEDFSVCEECKYKSVCMQMEKAPSFWDLTDPPRFTEAQMAFWRGLFAIGIRRVRLTEDKKSIHMFDGKDAFAISTMSAESIETGLNAFETLDLAELLGKDGKE